MTINYIQKQSFLRLHNQGNSLKEISQLSGNSTNTIRKYLFNYNIRIKKNNIIKTLKIKDNSLIGLYCGLWAGDGTQYYTRGYRIKFCYDSRNKELLKFTQELLIHLFGKTSRIVVEERHRGFVIFNSKFIYNFIKEYLTFGRNKTYTVCLKDNIKEYSKEFLEGFILGLMLTDGYLKHRTSFNITSKFLAINFQEICSLLGFKTKIYVSKRKNVGWADLNMVYMTKKESKLFLTKLDDILKKKGYKKCFSCLKGYGTEGI